MYSMACGVSPAHGIEAGFALHKFGVGFKLLANRGRDQRDFLQSFIGVIRRLQSGDQTLPRVRRDRDGQ